MENSATGEEPWKVLLPSLAPLPESFLAHIFQHPSDLRFSPPSSHPTEMFVYLWPYIQRARQLVSYFLVPTIASGQKLSWQWFHRHYEMYAGSNKRLAPTTKQEWINKNHIRTLSPHYFEPNSVASVFIMRYLFARPDRWLPPRQKPDSAWFFVWGLLPGEKIPRIYRYPLATDLPANLLLFTQWMGASWQPGWIVVPGLGALAWGKITTRANEWRWSITEEQMAAWDRDFVEEYSVVKRLYALSLVYGQLPEQGFPDSPEHYALSRTQDLAYFLLQRVGEPILARYLMHTFLSDKTPTGMFTL